MAACNFSIVLNDCEECFLNLYHIFTKEETRHLNMKQDPWNPDIYSYSTDLKKEEIEYTFEAKGQTFLDPYVKVVRGRDTFGQKVEDANLRGAFLTEFPQFEQDKPLHKKLHELIFYKLHVRGFTKHASSGTKHPGTYAALIEKIPYLKQLGINAVLLLPVMEFQEVVKRPYSMETKINYWGFETETFYFAPKASYAANPLQPDYEFKQMVQAFHQNGIEVMLEMNFTNRLSPYFMIEVLRYWASEYHIDGFCPHISDCYRSIVAADPYLANVVLLDSSYNTGEVQQFTREHNCPSGLAEYNDQFLTNARRLLRGDEDQLGGFTSRFSQVPAVNYITNHDGFTLQDLYCYDLKHNEDNLEGNHDGREYNFGWNCGREGITKDRKVNELRRRMIRNALATLFLAQGSPMILAGDEFGATQNGNNNSYCQDNEISWLDWTQYKKNRELQEFVQNLIHLRNAHPILQGASMLRGMDYIYCGMPDVSYHGVKVWQPDFHYYRRELGILLCGDYAKISAYKFDQSFYLLFNMYVEPHEFDLPRLKKHEHWELLMDTGQEIYFPKDSFTEGSQLEDQMQYHMKERSIAVLIQTKES